ncbi:MAG: YdbL family protein [Candidatus Omnitrophica bacterium]|nr:YdbL family protein [Candidatus Omnitrophota bacterium]
MKGLKLLLIFGLFFVIGCATLKVKAPEEAIKVDISMRLDIYQHVQNDIDAIESIVTGSDDKKKPGDDQSMLNYIVGTAYAQDLSSGLEEAALRRKARYGEITPLEQAGVLGESNSGLIVIRGSADSSISNLVSDENNDRIFIYKGIAKKNGTSVSEVQKIYAERLQGSAPSGTPIETSSGSWRIK